MGCLNNPLQFPDKSMYENVQFSENVITDLAEKPIRYFNVCVVKLFFKKELEYFTYYFGKATNLEK